MKTLGQILTVIGAILLFFAGIASLDGSDSAMSFTWISMGLGLVLIVPGLILRRLAK